MDESCMSTYKGRFNVVICVILLDSGLLIVGGVWVTVDCGVWVCIHVMVPALQPSRRSATAEPSRPAWCSEHTRCYWGAIRAPLCIWWPRMLRLCSEILVEILLLEMEIDVRFPEVPWGAFQGHAVPGAGVGTKPKIQVATSRASWASIQSQAKLSKISRQAVSLRHFFLAGQADELQAWKVWCVMSPDRSCQEPVFYGNVWDPVIWGLWTLHAPSMDLRPETSNIGSFGPTGYITYIRIHIHTHMYICIWHL